METWGKIIGSPWFPFHVIGSRNMTFFFIFVGEDAAICALGVNQIPLLNPLNSAETVPS